MCSCKKELNACGCNSHSNFSSSELTVDNLVSGAKDVGEDLVDVAKSTTEFVVDEVKEGYGKLKTEGKRFDEKERLIKSIPNSYLVFGGLAILIYSIAK